MTYVDQTPPSPAVTESEMNAVQSVFQRMATTIVEASKLSSDVNELRNTVEAMKRDLESQRNNNAWLDSQLAETRRAKDEAVTELLDTKDQLRQTLDNYDRVSRDFQATGEIIRRHEQETQQLRRERDDAQMRNMELEDKLKASEDRWNKLAEAFGSIQLAAQPHPSEPTSEQTKTHNVDEPFQYMRS